MWTSISTSSGCGSRTCSTRIDRLVAGGVPTCDVSRWLCFRSSCRPVPACPAARAARSRRALGAVAGPPTTVAVLPLRFSGSDSSLRPLERGFAELLTTDLSRSSKLTVVERARIQTLLDELALQRSGQTDASTNVRAGRLLRAGRVVQGSIVQVGGSELRVDSAVLDVPTTEVRGRTSGEDQLDQLFDPEKRIALGLFNQLGVT